MDIVVAMNARHRNTANRVMGTICGLQQIGKMYLNGVYYTW